MWKPGDLIKTVIPRKPWKYEDPIVVTFALIIKRIDYYDYYEQSESTPNYEVLIQNGPIVQRPAASIYSVETPDEDILRRENEIPF